MFDIDHFKKVNDQYGHLNGDEVLISIAKVIGDMIRTEDVFGRFGGEEFAILAPRINIEGAKVFAERIRAKIEALSVPARDHGNTQIEVTVSVGSVTIHPEAIVDTPTVISVADDNLYKAKEQGRNTVIATTVQ